MKTKRRNNAWRYSNLHFAAAIRQPTTGAASGVLMSCSAIVPAMAYQHNISTSSRTSLLDDWMSELFSQAHGSDAARAITYTYRTCRREALKAQSDWSVSSKQTNERAPVPVSCICLPRHWQRGADFLHDMGVGSRLVLLLTCSCCVYAWTRELRTCWAACCMRAAARAPGLFVILGQRCADAQRRGE